MTFFAASEAPPRPESMKFPVNSLLAGNLAFSETSSQLTPPSSRESVSRPHPLSKVQNPAFRAGVRGWLGDRVGRDAQVVSIPQQPVAISLSGHIPVPQCR